MKFEFNMCGRHMSIPIRMRPSLERYVNEGILPGDFLKAVITNDLKESVARADEENLLLLPAYAAFFYNSPMDCSGSKEKMLAWNTMGGLNGVN